MSWLEFDLQVGNAVWRDMLSIVELAKFVHKPLGRNRHICVFAAASTRQLELSETRPTSAGIREEVQLSQGDETKYLLYEKMARI